MTDTIERFIQEDLSCYGQHNPCPKSLTVVNGELWRHYELGAIHGFILWNEKYIDGPANKFWIASISEDDENWFVDEGMFMDAAWVNAVNATWQRMVKWRSEHIVQGWQQGADISNPGEYVSKTIKEVIPEKVMWEGEPDNSVLGTNYCYINE